MQRQCQLPQQLPCLLLQLLLALWQLQRLLLLSADLMPLAYMHSAHVSGFRSQYLTLGHTPRPQKRLRFGNSLFAIALCCSCCGNMHNCLMAVRFGTGLYLPCQSCCMAAVCKVRLHTHWCLPHQAAGPGLIARAFACLVAAAAWQQGKPPS